MRINEYGHSFDWSNPWAITVTSGTGLYVEITYDFQDAWVMVVQYGGTRPHSYKPYSWNHRPSKLEILKALRK